MVFAEDITEFRQTAEAKIIRRTIRTMSILLILMTLVALVTEVTLHYQQIIVGQYATAVNPAGRQRMLSQRIVYLSEVLVTTTSPAIRFNTSIELGNVAAEMRLERDSLLVNIPLPSELNRLYYADPVQLKAQVDSYTDAALELAGSDNWMMNSPQYQKIVGDAPRLLSDLEVMVKTYENLLRDSVGQLREMDKGRTAFILIGLAVAGMLVLWPSVRRVTRYINKLYRHISSLRQQIKLLEDRQAFSDSIIDSLPTALSVYDITTGQTVFMSERYRKMLGYSEADGVIFELYNLDGVVHVEDIERAQSCMTKAAETGVTTLGEYRMRRKDGSYIMVESRAMALRQQGVMLDPPQLVALIRELDDSNQPKAA